MAVGCPNQRVLIDLKLIWQGRMSFKAAITRVKIELLNVDAVHIQRLQLVMLAQGRYTLILLEELGKLFIVVDEVFLVEHLH